MLSDSEGSENEDEDSNSDTSDEDDESNSDASGDDDDDDKSDTSDENDTSDGEEFLKLKVKSEPGEKKEVYLQFNFSELSYVPCVIYFVKSLWK